MNIRVPRHGAKLAIALLSLLQGLGCSIGVDSEVIVVDTQASTAAEAGAPASPHRIRE